MRAPRVYTTTSAHAVALEVFGGGVNRVRVRNIGDVPVTVFVIQSGRQSRTDLGLGPDAAAVLNGPDGAEVYARVERGTAKLEFSDVD